MKCDYNQTRELKDIRKNEKKVVYIPMVGKTDEVLTYRRFANSLHHQFTIFVYPNSLP